MTITSAEFESRIKPFRRELLVHCYQLLGSVHDAEDLVQETLLRAWRAFDRYDDRRASLRTWLYRIATNVCLTALEKRKRRPLPSGLGGPSEDAEGPLIRGREVPWLQPFPDRLLGTERNDPAMILAARGRLRLALVAAMQFLPARQRAVLILRDVLDWSAAEVADLLGTSSAAVNSALQRARARLAEVGVGVGEEQITEPADRAGRAIIDQYVAAFEHADLVALKRLLTADAVLEMPPFLNWFAGREAYGRFMSRFFGMRGTGLRMIPTAANGQPAGAAYVRDQEGIFRLHTLQVFSVTAAAVSRNTVFQDAEVFALFQLPATLPMATG